jgi:hypothetical protein
MFDLSISEFDWLYDYSQDGMRRLMNYPKQHTLARLVHRLRAFRDEETEWLFTVLYYHA